MSMESGWMRFRMPSQRNRLNSQKKIQLLANWPSHPVHLQLLLCNNLWRLRISWSKTNDCPVLSARHHSNLPSNTCVYSSFSLHFSHLFRPIRIYLLHVSIFFIQCGDCCPKNMNCNMEIISTAFEYNSASLFFVFWTQWIRRKYTVLFYVCVIVYRFQLVLLILWYASKSVFGYYRC